MFIKADFNLVSFLNKMKRGPFKRKQGPNDSNLGGSKIWKSPYKVNYCISGTKFCYWAPAKYKSGPTKLKGGLEQLKGGLT